MTDAVCERRIEGLPCDCEQCQADEFERALGDPIEPKEIKALKVARYEKLIEQADFASRGSKRP